MFLFQYLPYYRFGFNEIFTAEYWLLSWMAISLVVIQFINDSNQSGATIMMYISIPIVILLAVLAVRVRRRTIMKHSVPHLNSPEEVSFGYIL